MSELKNEIADKTVQVERIRDQLRVDMVDEVLFDSGEATLKPAGIAVLGKIGGVLAKATDRRVEVQGHTDNVPITGALAKRFPTNWELSAARATNVVRFLQEEAKIDPTRLSAAGYAEFRPKASNDTDAGTAPEPPDRDPAGPASGHGDARGPARGRGPGQRSKLTLRRTDRPGRATRGAPKRGEPATLPRAR